VNPPLSATARPPEEMGRTTVKRLLRSRDLEPKMMPHRLVISGRTPTVRRVSKCQLASGRPRTVTVGLAVCSFHSSGALTYGSCHIPAHE
jgi:hypothetical protein